MAQSNFDDHFERSLKETKHFHFELLCGTMKWLNFLCYMLSNLLYAELGRKSDVGGIITEHPRALGDKPPLFVFPRLGGFTCLIFALSITS